MAEQNLNGLGVALVTPFHKDKSIDYESLAGLIDHVIEGGCDYIVALGTTAETPTLTTEEKIILTDYIREQNSGRVPLVIGIGGNNTKGLCEELKSRDLTGYSAVLSVTPYYNKPTQEGLYAHYSALAESSPLPILLYNVPGRTGVNMTARTTLRLAEAGGDKFCGIKEASGNLEQVREILASAPEGFKVMSGDDSLTCRFMRLGANGVISVLANAYPAQVRRLVSLGEAECHKDAEQLQQDLQEFTDLLFVDGNPAGIKCALSQIGLIENELRLPLVRVSEHVATRMKEASTILGDLI